jgi:Lrp/AsnC family leucine-responsive transcriptional regulator
MALQQNDQREIRRLTYKPAKMIQDPVNVRILEELTLNPRASVAAVGRRVGLSPPAAGERIKRLEETGVITGYQISIAPDALGLPISAYIRVRPNPGQLTRVAELARSIPEVVECHRITGEDCFIMRVFLPAMDQLDRVLDQFLIYGTTTTSIVQSSPVPIRSLPLPVPEA